MTSERPMQVSVVIPTFNRKNLVVRTIESVLAQTRAPLEVIVVDDGSTDSTSDALRKDGDRIVYVFQSNAGVSAARNRGMQKATGDAIAFVDSDDVWLPRMLEVLVAPLETSPAAVA